MELAEAYGSGYMLGGKKHHKKATKKHIRGGDFFSDFGHGLEEGLSGVLGVAQQLAPLAGEAGLFAAGRKKHPHHKMHHAMHHPHMMHHAHEKITPASALAHSVQLAKMGKKIGMPMHHGGAQIYEGGAQIYEGGSLFSGLERDIEYAAQDAIKKRRAQQKRMEESAHHGGYGLGGYGLGGSTAHLRNYKHHHAVEEKFHKKELKAAVKKMTKAELQHALLREIKK